MMNSYQNVWASLMKITNDFSAANPQYEFSTFDFDANVEEKEYPAGNLIGIYQLDYSENDDLINVSVAFPFSMDDTFLLNEAIGKFIAHVRSQTNHPLVDYESEAIVGRITARNDLAVSPVIKSTNRQFKFVAQSFAFDRSATFRLDV